MGMGMGVSFQYSMGMGTSISVIFENKYECGYSSTRPEPARKPQLISSKYGRWDRIDWDRIRN